MHETRKKYTVLLLSAPIGSGHRLAAEALEQAFADRPEVEVIHGNIFDFFPQFLGKAFLGTYLWILKCCPWLYKLAYSWGNKQGGSLWLRELLNRLLVWLGGSYLRSVQPGEGLLQRFGCQPVSRAYGCRKQEHSIFFSCFVHMYHHLYCIGNIANRNFFAKKACYHSLYIVSYF